LALSFTSIFISFLNEVAQFECSYCRTTHHAPDAWDTEKRQTKDIMER